MKVVIYADTCLEWIVTALACFKIHCTIATLYTNLGTDGVAYGIGHVEPKLIITNHEILPKLIATLNESFKNKSCVKNIVYFDHPLPTEEKSAEGGGELNNFNIISLR